MCGICGVIQVRGSGHPPVAPHVLDHMTDSMTHRGPDDRGTVLDDGVALGVRRLSIVDVAGGHQPFASEDGSVWAAQNGELYNHAEIARGLRARGHALTSRCDTEVIPHLYEEHGPSFAERLRGKFGIAVWDSRRRVAVLTRDRLGVKPLYYAEAGDQLVFGSELKAVLASGLVAPELDYEAIDAYLTLGYVPGPATPLRGVRKLPPGCRLVVSNGRVAVERYWSYPMPRPGKATEPAEAYGERLLEALRESVRVRLMSDVPLGAMLSGGLDSSLIVALMAEEMGEPVKTFSIGFAESAGNELDDARMVARALGTEHHELELSLADRPVDLEDLVWQLDEPLASVSALGFSALSRLAADHVTVALSGQGADELLGGYRKHLAASLTGRSRVLRSPARLLTHAPGRTPRAISALAADDAATRLLAMSGRLDAATRMGLARGPLAELDGLAGERALRARLGQAADNPLESTLYLDAQMALVDDMLHYFDRTSMAHSLEVRVPFLDDRVVELCATIPSEYKVRHLTTKYVLKKAARGLVPQRVITKRKIGFFHRSISEWFGAQLTGSAADYLLDPGAAYAELLDQREVARLVAAHRSGADTGNAHALLSVLMLEIWLTTYLPRALGTGPARGERAAA
jgi:asparagine synthase (glutamine-hydrolysing)